MIDSIVKEDLHERADSDVREGAHSYATLKVLCHQVGARKKTRAMMRIYYQIPWTGTDHAEKAIRAAQATTFKPRELEAYQALSKDPYASKFTPRLLGFGELKQGIALAVPGGFLTLIVWEVVPGLRLGNRLGPSGFWSRPLEEQNLVRECFKKTLLEIRNTGFFPRPCAPLNLVWHAESKTLYWVGFREALRCRPGEPWTPVWLAMFELVKWPRNEQPMRRGWNGDISNRKY